MTIGEMFQQSAILTVLGMATVFIFLWLMIICINLVGKMVHFLGLDKDIPPRNKLSKKTNNSTQTKITAVITAAITEYQRNGEADE
ncbi:MAG: OadG family protein [Treponema sp.]|nr:OadG family protein [Treponema sp.]